MPSSSEVVEDNKPVLSFVVVVAAIVGSFYLGRKFLGGTIPALILSYLMYVYRDDISKGFGELLKNGRRES
jgi:hypothetical protein